MWTVNGVDPKTLGLYLEQPRAWSDDPSTEHQTIVIPGRAGELAITPVANVRSRRLTVSGALIGTSASDLRTKLDSCKALFKAGQPLTVVFNDRLTRQYTLYCESSTLDLVGPFLVARKIPVALSLVAFDPFGYDTTLTNVALDVDGEPIPTGTAPFAPTISIAGASTNPVFTFKNSSAVTVGTLTLTVTTLGGHTLVVDCAAKTILHNGVAHPEYLTGGDFFVIRPEIHANYLGSVWPTLACSSGAATASYRKAWR